ncbi:hypothetical protein GGR55DRAFT_699656 [Xylaria sp. FL0064]|nr:hypothetical protein GGR55DRAFT_699656 [Xylaria sp. FL0064]
MPTVDGVPRFWLPPELRLMVWGFASRSGPMRLSLVKIYHSNNNDSPHICFELPSKWYKHVSTHQKQRMTILHVNREARFEALKYLDLISTHDFPLFVSPREHNKFHDTVVSERPRPRILAVEWYNDLIHLPWCPSLKVLPAVPFDKITRLAVNPNGIYHPIVFHTFARHRSLWAKKLLETFPALKHLTIVLDVFDGVGVILENYDYISCLKDIAKNEYYFSPSPRKTLDEWLLRVYSRGSMDPKALEGQRIQSWPSTSRRYGSHRVPAVDVEVIREKIAELKPEVEVEDVVDTTTIYLWE